MATLLVVVSACLGLSSAAIADPTDVWLIQAGGRVLQTHPMLPGIRTANVPYVPGPADTGATSQVLSPHDYATWRGGVITALTRIRGTVMGAQLLRVLERLSPDARSNDRWQNLDGSASDTHLVIVPAPPRTGTNRVRPLGQNASNGLGSDALLNIATDVLTSYFRPDGAERLRSPAVSLFHELVHAAHFRAGAVSPKFEQVRLPVALADGVRVLGQMTVGVPLEEIVTVGSAGDVAHAKTQLDIHAIRESGNARVYASTRAARDRLESIPGMETAAITAAFDVYTYRLALARLHPTETTFCAQLGEMPRPSYVAGGILNPRRPGDLITTRIFSHNSAGFVSLVDEPVDMARSPEQIPSLRLIVDPPSCS